MAESITTRAQFAACLANESARRRIGVDVSDADALKILASEYLTDQWYQWWSRRPPTAVEPGGVRSPSPETVRWPPPRTSMTPSPFAASSPPAPMVARVPVVGTLAPPPVPAYAQVELGGAPSPTSSQHKGRGALAGIGLTLSILGVIAGLLLPALGLITCAAGLILAIVALRRANRRRSRTGVAVAGVIVGVFGLIVAVASWAIWATLAVSGEQAPSTSVNSSADGQESNVQLGAPVGAAEVDAEINDAVEVVNEFWSDNFADFYSGGSYQPPIVGGAYTSNELPTCAGEQLEPYNAYYCVADNTLWWDADLMKEAYSAGDAIVYLVVAHEWGHAIQAQIDDVWVAEELQADCFAAAALYGAAEDEYFVWEAGDTAEITSGLTALSDETPWTDTSDHGDPLDRIDAFNDGRVSGVPGCYTVSD